MKSKHYLFIIAMLSMLLSCSKDQEQEVDQSISIEPQNLELAIGGEYQLNLTVTPDQSLAGTAQWETSDASVVTVDSKGLVKAISAGSVVVSARIGNLEALCNVKVNEAELEKIELEPSEIIIKKSPDRTEKISVKIYPEELKDITLKWSSSDEKVATVDNNGVVTPVGPGECVVTASCGDKSAECKVYVDAILLNEYVVESLPERVVDLTAEIVSNSGDVETIEWSSSDPSMGNTRLCSDTKGQIILGSKTGEVIITASSDGMSTECKIKIHEYKAPEGVGDFIFSDGTRSSSLVPGKEPVGIVFWTGDPTENDPMLKRDYPECTNGLAMALTEVHANYVPVIDGPIPIPVYTGSIGAWIEENASEYGDFLEDYPFVIRGYNNTLALQAFNASPENSDWILVLPEELNSFNNENPTPENASKWYIPSFQELNLLCNCDYEENILEKNYQDIINHKARYLNTRLSMVDGAELLCVDGTASDLYKFYWSSSEYINVEYMGAQNRFMMSINMAKGNDSALGDFQRLACRFVFAF